MRFRFAPLPFLVVLSLCIASQGQTLLADESLAGLPGVYVLVEGMDSDAERDGLTTLAIQTAVELRLRQYGIKVLTKDESLAHPRGPYLYVNVHALKHKDMELYTYHIGVNLKQLMEIPGTTNSVIGATWYRGSLSTVGANNLRDAKETVLDHVDVFINAFLAANPKE